MTCGKLKEEAKHALSGNWGVAIVATVIAMILGGVLPIILTGPMLLGLFAVIRNIRLKGSARVSDVFNGLNRFGTAICLYLLKGLFTFLWSLLLIIPGIIANFRYSMAEFILLENDNITAREAITMSKNLMKGHKGKLFCLYFSFIGWWLLSLVTFGIAALWVSPYVKEAEYCFYNSIKPVAEETVVLDDDIADKFWEDTEA